MNRTFAVLLIIVTVSALLLVTVQSPITGGGSSLPPIGQRSQPTLANPVEAVSRYNRAGFIRAAETVNHLRLR